MTRMSRKQIVACGLMLLSSMGFASASTAQDDVIVEAGSDVCAVLTAFMAEVAPHHSRQTYGHLVTAKDGTQAPADFSGMPDAVVWPMMGVAAPTPFEAAPDATEEERRWIAERNAEEASVSIEDRVEGGRTAFRDGFDHLRDVPGFDDELGESFLNSYGPAQRLACSWSRGVEQLAENEDPGSDTGTRWRRVIETFSMVIDLGTDPPTESLSPVPSRIVHEPAEYSFSGVGISRDGRRALLHYSYWILNGHWGSPRGPEGLVFGGHGGAGFAILERMDDGWRIAGTGDTTIYN